MFWAELVRRERRLTATQAQFDTVMSYVMGGLSPSVEFNKRYEVLEPHLKNLVGEIDQSRYTTHGKRIELERKKRKAVALHQELDRLQQITSDKFDLQGWLRGDK